MHNDASLQPCPSLLYFSSYVYFGVNYTKRFRHGYCRKNNWGSSMDLVP